MAIGDLMGTGSIGNVANHVVGENISRNKGRDVRMKAIFDHGGRRLKSRFKDPKQLSKASPKIQNMGTLMEELVALLEPPATDSTPVPQDPPPVKLTYDPPLYAPGPLLPWLQHLFRSQTVDTELSESMVDAESGTFLAHYFTLAGQFIVRPQHTYRALASIADQAISNKWSMKVQNLSGDDQADWSLFLFSDNEIGSQDISFNPATASTPPLTNDVNLSSSPELDFNFSIGPGAVDISWTKMKQWLPSPETDPQDNSVHKGANTTISSVPTEPDISELSAILDELGRLVVEKGRNALKRHELTVVHPLLEPCQDTLIAIVENKFKDKARGVAQLRAYAKDHHKNSSRMWSFTFVLNSFGLQVAMFKFDDSSDELVAVAEDKAINGKKDVAAWYPVTMLSASDSIFHSITSSAASTSTPDQLSIWLENIRSDYA
ncbi:hypothetical protein BDP27DRAFT_1367234 [Rhodocollybia butyracea]|uniref:Uncharacterized protein n=1 Tax=Rhodocollybia butyracea TaxID=206335 RepID=A0A9P5U2Z2_9AGAR|nr:hypothetical protein BDP27DRAFT_1367234 [Rhodocollybia butyracea]